MKRILSLILCLVTIFSFAGCSEDKPETKSETTSKIDTNPQKSGIIYSDIKLDEYVEIGAYKDLIVDTKSADFKKYYNSVVESDVSNNNLYVKKTKGKVKTGDVANIDYVGKLDGKAFDGGSAKGYDLEIGSGTFIPGFESSLVGKEIGKTHDINVTFPENYSSAELAGKPVIFTVTINYIKTDKALKPSAYYKQLGYKTLKAYEEHVKETATKNYLMDKVATSSKTIKYPEKELKYLTAAFMKMMSVQLSAQQNISLEDYLTQTGTTPEEYTKSVQTEQIKPTMDRQMIIFGILQKEKVKITSKEVDDKIAETLMQTGGQMSKADIIDYFGEYYFEYLIAMEKSLDILCDYAKIS